MEHTPELSFKKILLIYPEAEGSSERVFGCRKSENRRKNRGGGESGEGDISQGPSGGSEPV